MTLLLCFTVAAKSSLTSRLPQEYRIAHKDN